MKRPDKRGNNYPFLIAYNKKNGPWNKEKKGLQIAWNKGLTKETDHRIRNYSIKLSRSRRGMKLSEQHRLNISKALRGRIAPNKGIPASEDTKKKLSIIFSGKRNPFYGKKHTELTKIKISNCRLYNIKGETKDNVNFLEDNKKEIINFYLNGESSNKIGERFGMNGSTILNYLKKWSVSVRKSYYGSKKLLICNDRHKVRSHPEVLIDNFLFENGVTHLVEKAFDFQNKQFKCDFYLPELDLYIEYFGIYHNRKYLLRKERKLNLYRKLKLNLLTIEWYEDPIEKLRFLIPVCSKKQTTLAKFA